MRHSHVVYFRQIFDMYDKNGDNVINVEELRGILEILGYSPTPEEVKTILGECAILVENLYIFVYKNAEHSLLYNTLLLNYPPF